MICENCGKREGTKKWLGDGGSLALSHGFWKMWCEICCLEAQLKFARERADEIPNLEAKLTEALARESG